MSRCRPRPPVHSTRTDRAPQGGQGHQQRGAGLLRGPRPPLPPSISTSLMPHPWTLAGRGSVRLSPQLNAFFTSGRSLPPRRWSTPSAPLRTTGYRGDGRARGGIRTHTSFRTADFESAASAIPPLGLVGGASVASGQRYPRRSIIRLVTPMTTLTSSGRRATRADTSRQPAGYPPVARRLGDERLASTRHACVHLPGPGLAAPGHGAALGRPRELGAGRGGVVLRRARCGEAAARCRRRRAEGHPQRPALHVRHQPDGGGRGGAARHRAELLRRSQPGRVHRARWRAARCRFDEGVRLVCERAEAMHEAGIDNPGTMAAVLGLDDDDVEIACRRADADVWVANFNAPGQVVIAGSAEGRGRRRRMSPRSSAPRR